MKIFVTSDLHGNPKVIEKLYSFIKKRKDIDFMVLCGDITGDHQVYDYETLQVKQYEEYLKIIELFESINQKVIGIQGNHDAFEFESFNFHMYGTMRETDEEGIARGLSRVKKLYNTLVFNVACDKNIARGWIVDTESKKYEKIILK